MIKDDFTHLRDDILQDSEEAPQSLTPIVHALLLIAQMLYEQNIGEALNE